MTCPSGTASDECGWGEGASVNIISGTRYEAVMSASSFYISYGCDYNSVATKVTCTAEMTGEDPQTAVLSGTDVAFVTATVVEGDEMLSAGSATVDATASTGSSAVSKSSSAAASSRLQTSIASASNTAAAESRASGTAATGSHASGSASTATATSSPPQSTGAAAKFGVEGAALLALAGAAVLNAL